MSPPIRDGSGNSIGSVRLGDGSEISEVRTGAGDVLFSASDSELTQIADHIWFMDEGSGSTLADSVGSADASMNFSTWQTGEGNNDTYPEWDGSDDRADPGITFTSPVTVSFWAFSPDNERVGQYIWDHGTATGENNFISENYSGGQSTHYIGGQIAGRSIGGPTASINPNEWYLVTLTYGSGAAKLYIDDTEEDSSSTSTPAWDDQFYIGNRSDNNRAYDNGIDYGVVAFQVATQSQIAEHFQQTKGLYGR